jgi:general secretion pathway protein J
MRRLPRPPATGFTLIELMVSIFIMSMLALMSWRGIDGMARAQDISRERADAVATMQTALSQWQSDLDHMQQARNGGSSIDYDGRVVRIVRYYGSTELRVVAWGKRIIDGQTRWLRWQSDPATTRFELESALLQAAQWGVRPTDAQLSKEVSLATLDDLQIFYYRNDAWSNPLSNASSNAVPAPPVVTPPVPGVAAGAEPPPDGVRLVLKLSPGQALAGTLIRDWVQPTIGGNKT